LAGVLCFLAPLHAQFFTDVTAQDQDRGTLEDVAASQLMEGFRDGSFHPNQPVCRADSVMVLARLLNLSLKGFMVLPGTPALATLQGIPTTHWVYPAARFLAEHGMLSGAEAVGGLSVPLTRGEFLAALSPLLHAGVPQRPEIIAGELTENLLLPDGWPGHLQATITRRELARIMNDLLFYLTQHAVTEGTITAFETDANGTRWVHLMTTIGEARLCMPVRSVLINNGTENTLSEGAKVRTVSDAVPGMHGNAFFRVREVTVMPVTAQR
jgi:hypothetical protein